VLMLTVVAATRTQHASGVLAHGPQAATRAHAGPLGRHRLGTGGSTAALVVASKGLVAPSLLTPANLLALGKRFHNTIGAGKHHHVVALPVQLLGTGATPTVKVALATIRRQRPVRLYLLGMTHGQRLTLVVNTLFSGVAVYINKTPRPAHSLAALSNAIRAAKHFVPIVARHGTGLRLLNANQVAASTPLQSPNVATSPSYSLDLGRLPPVGDQGKENSCVGWAVSYYYKTYQEAEEHYWPVNDANDVFSPSFVYNQINRGRNDGQDGGSIPPAAMQLLVQEGDAPWEVFPYQPGDYLTQPSQDVLNAASPYTAGDFGYLSFAPHAYSDPPPYDNDIQPLKQWLAAGDGFVIGMPVYQSFQAYTGGVYDADVSTESRPSGHALFVIGYDDNAEGTGIGAFRVVNQWGHNWGENGFGWISYDYFRHYVYEAWAMHDAPNDPMLSHPTLGANPSPSLQPSLGLQPQQLAYTTQDSWYSLTLLPNDDYIALIHFVYEGLLGGQVMERHDYPYDVEVQPGSDLVFTQDYIMDDGTILTAQVEVQTPTA
jgi:C1A family cysteine protease